MVTALLLAAGQSSCCCVTLGSWTGLEGSAPSRAPQGAWSGLAIWHSAVPGVSLIPGEHGQQLLWEHFPPCDSWGCPRHAELLSQRKAKSHPWSSPNEESLWPVGDSNTPPSSAPFSASGAFPDVAGRSQALLLSSLAGWGLMWLCPCSSSPQVSTAAVGTCSVPFTGTLTCTPAPTTTRQKLPRRSARKTPSLSPRRSRSCEGV